MYSCSLLSGAGGLVSEGRGEGAALVGSEGRGEGARMAEAGTRVCEELDFGGVNCC